VKVRFLVNLPLSLHLLLLNKPNPKEVKRMKGKCKNPKKGKGKGGKKY
jgi:hypothetical protein